MKSRRARLFITDALFFFLVVPYPPSPLASIRRKEINNNCEERERARQQQQIMGLQLDDEL
jgi:hypothetical protein